MRELNDFFETLYERLWDENYLSDITYALLKTDSNFRSIFFEFCFEEQLDNLEVIEREHTEGKSRPDFYFKDEQNNEYILEVKIYDKNTHEEYRSVFKNAKKLSFIANYEAKGYPYYAEKTYNYVKTWYNFVPYLQKKIETIQNRTLLDGYLAYLKKTTNFLEAKSMNLSTTKSLTDFNTLLDKIIRAYPDNLLSPNNSKAHCGYQYYGKNIKYKKQKKVIEFWFGVNWYDPERIPFVTITYSEFKGKPKGKNYYVDKAEPQWICLKDELNERLNNSKEKKEEQEKILVEFLTEFVSEL